MGPWNCLPARQLAGTTDTQWCDQETRGAGGHKVMDSYKRLRQRASNGALDHFPSSRPWVRVGHVVSMDMGMKEL